jgi:hypothetical protein
MAHHWTGILPAICTFSPPLSNKVDCTSVVPPTFNEVAEKAVASRAEWRAAGAGHVIFTLVEFETEAVLKVNAEPSLLL